jgi:hypothetical protein
VVFEKVAKGEMDTYAAEARRGELLLGVVGEAFAVEFILEMLESERVVEDIGCFLSITKPEIRSGCFLSITKPEIRSGDLLSVKFE